MSATVKDLWNMILKSLGLIVFAVIAWTFSKAYDKLEKTSDSIIRMEQKFTDFEKQYESDTRNVYLNMQVLEAQIKKSKE